MQFSEKYGYVFYDQELNPSKYVFIECLLWRLALLHYTGNRKEKNNDVTCKFSMIKGIITPSVKQLCQHDLII